MKKIILTIVFFMMFSSTLIAEEKNYYQDLILEKIEQISNDIKNIASSNDVGEPWLCPVPKGTQIDCLRCHVEGNFAVKETNPDDLYKYPNKSMKRVKGINGNDILYFYLTEIPENELRDAFEYMMREDLKKIVIEIHSGGGVVYHAVRNKNIIDLYKAKGIEIETRCYGLAASAGFVLFLAGDTRLMSEQAMLMWHEIQSYKVYYGTGFAVEVSTPSGKEEEAKNLRWLNDNMQSYVASRCNLEKTRLDDLVRNKELWVNHKQAIEYGFATGIIE